MPVVNKPTQMIKKLIPLLCRAWILKAAIDLAVERKVVQSSQPWVSQLFSGLNTENCPYHIYLPGGGPPESEAQQAHSKDDDNEQMWKNCDSPTSTETNIYMLGVKSFPCTCVPVHVCVCARPKLLLNKSLSQLVIVEKFHASSPSEVFFLIWSNQKDKHGML